VARFSFAGRRHALRRAARAVRNVLAAGLGLVLTAGGMALPPAAVAVAVAGATAVAVGGVAAAPTARAATPPGKALVLLQNGESTAPETTALRATGWTVDQATPAQWLADSATTFKSYAVLVIGDPSTTSGCLTLTPTTATSGTDAIGTTWQSAVSGNLAVLGTAPAAAGTTAASNLVTASARYAASGYSQSAGTGTGLYVSLNCEYKTAGAKTAVPLLNGVEGAGTAGGLTVRGGLSCSDAGTVNKWEASAAGTFGGVTSGSLGTGSWASPGCPVQEAFSSWPTLLTPVAYDAAADATANFTASDGVSGQPYVLLGQPVSAATAALAPSTGGEVLPGTTVGGGNAAAPGVNQATAADPVNTESGEYTQSAGDLSVPGFGPALDFTRTYDARAARLQTVTGTPGPLGYGWTDNWATSLTLQRPVPGDIYTVNPAGVFPDEPVDMVEDAAGDVLYADAGTNDVVEVASAAHAQFGISMTAGHAYVVAGSPTGASGKSGNGGPATSALLNVPWGLALDGSGDLFINDQSNNRIQEVPAVTGTQFGISMTANHIYTVAGSATGTAGSSGDGGAATSALLNTPDKVRTDRAGNLYITDSQNFRVQEVPAATGTQRGQSMTAGDMYTIAGQAGTNQYSGDGGTAASARFISPAGLALDAAGNLYVSDDYVNVVREIPAASGTQWGQAMTAGDIYTIAGSSAVAGTGGSSGDGGPATAAQLNSPSGIGVDPAGDLYIGDTFNNRLQEVPVASGTQWGQPMTAGDMYTVIGSSMVQGDIGDGGPAAAAELSWPAPVTFDPSGNMLIPDAIDSEIREVFATTSQLLTTSPASTGITVNQADGSQVTFYPQSGGSCTAPYVTAGGSGYCTLPQNTSAGLTYNSSAGTYTYTPTPGSSYTYSSSTGALKSESDAAGDILTVTASSPSPGSGHCPSSASSCTTITAASGRVLVLGYNSGGLVTSATDPLGRGWTYAYNTASQLTSATDPMSHVTSYTYGAGSTGNPQLASDLLTITSPNAQPGGPDAGDATVNVYDPLGRVTSQTDPMGYQTTFNYCVSAASGNCMDPATGTGLVTVHDPDGNSVVYSYQQGTLAATSAFTGTTLTSETDSVPDTAAPSTANPSGGTLLATAGTDGDGNTITTSYDADANQVSATSPGASGGPTTITNGYAEQDTSTEKSPNCASTGAVTATCTADAGPAPVSTGQVITPPSQVPATGVSWTQYDSEGNDLYTEIGASQPGGGSSAQVTYELHNGNSVTLPGTGTAVTCAASAPSEQLACATINSSGMVTQLAYDSAGDLISSSVPNGSGSAALTTTYAYDADGEQTSTTSPDGNLPGANAGNYTSTSAFNADGEQTSVAAGGGTGHTVTPRTTTTAYDADGNATTQTDALGNVTTNAYNADDEADLATDADGNATLTCYDGDGHPAQTVPPVGVAAGSLAPSSCPAAYPAGYGTRLAADATVSTYNGAGEVTQQTTPLPPGQTGPNPYETTTNSYDANGNVVETFAPPATAGGQVIATVSTYNSAGELAAQTTGYGTPAAATVSYCYDPAGKKTSVVTADGNQNGVAPCESSAPWTASPQANPAQAAYQTVYAYNTADQLVSVTRPGPTAASPGAVTTYTYDSGGALTSTTSPDGVTSTLTYTPDGQVAGVSYSGSSAPQVTYGYDAEDHVTSVTDGTGTSASTYDPFGELTSTTNGAGTTVGYAYDLDGHRTGVTYPLPATASWATTSTVAYAYDKAGLLAAVTDFNGKQVTITPDGDGHPSAVTLGTTGDTVSFTYGQNDAASSIALKGSGGNPLQSFAYADAPGNQILSETDTPASTGPSASYSYDGKGRLASAAPGTGAALSYTYDPSGNPLTLPTTASASYGDNSELTVGTLSGTTTSYAYDADGNRLSSSQGGSAVTSATWNGNDQLTAYTAPAASMAGAAYDAGGNRATASFTTPGGTTAESYVWDGDSLLMDSASAYVYAGSQYTPVEQVNLSTGAATYLVSDSLGSVRGTVNSTGALTGTTSYDAWGNPQAAGGLTATTPFGYAGGYTDPDGLIYLINRYYDPQTAQFTSLDPAVDQTLAPYAYTGGNPVSETDPTGQWSSSCTGGGSTAHRYPWALWFTCDQIRQAINNSSDFWWIKKYNQAGDTAFADAYYASMVCAGCNWDLKIYLRNNVNHDAIDNHTAVTGEAPYYAKVNASKQIFLNVWGNIFFGYVGRAAEFTAQNLKMGVNAAGLISSSFNNPGNVIQRQMGYDLFTNHPNSLSSANIDQQIQSKLGDFNYAQSKCDVMPLGDTWKTKNKTGSINYTTCNNGTTAAYGW
jgi:RHS repeat-associated protein